MRLSNLSIVVFMMAIASLESSPAPEPEPGIGAVLGALALGGGLLLGAKAFGGGYGGGYGGGGGCYSCGCGGCGGHCGWCGGHFSGGGCFGGCGGYGHRRRRAAVLTEFAEIPAVTQIYDMLVAEDTDGCGKRLVCELAQKDPRDLTSDELEMLMPYRGLGESDGTAYGDYDEAAWHGQKGDSCPELYPKCSHSANELMDIYHGVNSTSLVV